MHAIRRSSYVTGRIGPDCMRPTIIQSMVAMQIPPKRTMMNIQLKGVALTDVNQTVAEGDLLLG